MKIQGSNDKIQLAAKFVTFNVVLVLYRFRCTVRVQYSNLL